MHIKTPVHSHPLSSVEDPASRGRARRGQPEADSQKPNSNGNNYFTLKAKLEHDNSTHISNWDGSVRGYGKSESRKTEKDGSQLDTTPQGTSTRATPLFIVGSSRDPEIILEGPTDVEGISPAISSQVLATKWHIYTDEAIQSAIANLHPLESPANVPSHPYHTALRVLSSAVHSLSRARLEFEETRRVLQQKEVERRKRAEELLKELMPSEQEVARRVIQSLFTDDDEYGHKVKRKQSVLVCPNLQV